MLIGLEATALTNAEAARSTWIIAIATDQEISVKLEFISDESTDNSSSIFMTAGYKRFKFKLFFLQLGEFLVVLLSFSTFLVGKIGKFFIFDFRSVVIFITPFLEKCSSPFQSLLLDISDFDFTVDDFV